VVGLYIRSIGLTNRARVFHSFRHGFKDALRRAGVSEDLNDALTGHSGGGVGRATARRIWSGDLDYVRSLRRLRRCTIGVSIFLTFRSEMRSAYPHLPNCFCRVARFTKECQITQLPRQ